jgi:hypothetical protein
LSSIVIGFYFLPTKMMSSSSFLAHLPIYPGTYYNNQC